MFVKGYKTIDDFDGIYQYLFDTLFDEYYELCSPSDKILGKTKFESKEDFLSILAYQAIYYLLRNCIRDDSNMLDSFFKIKSINSLFLDSSVDRR